MDTCSWLETPAWSHDMPRRVKASRGETPGDGDEWATRAPSGPSA